jgi:hypothetical protein
MFYYRKEVFFAKVIHKKEKKNKREKVEKNG